MPRRYSDEEVEARMVPQIVTAIYPVLIPMEQQDTRIQAENQKRMTDLATMLWRRFTGGADLQEEHYQSAMAMSEKHRKLWVEASKANAKLRESLKIGYDAMKAALNKCQRTVDEILVEDREAATQRLAIFNDLDLPLAKVGCTMRAPDAVLASIDERIAEALAERTMTAQQSDRTPLSREPSSGAASPQPREETKL